MKRITVFCGSSMGNKDIFKNESTSLGKALVQRKIDLVYGGAKVGIMGSQINQVVSFFIFLGIINAICSKKINATGTAI